MNLKNDFLLIFKIRDYNTKIDKKIYLILPTEDEAKYSWIFF
jgi:hypothetical protein